MAKTLKEYEAKGEYILRKVFKNYKNILTEKYSRHDAFIETDDKIIIVEIKTRNDLSDYFSTDFLELKKYNALQKLLKIYKKKNKQIIIYYFVHFFDEKLFIYDITDLKGFTTSNVLCNKQSSKDLKDYLKKVPKDIIELDKRTAKKYTFYGQNH